MRKKACIGYENSVRDWVDGQGVSAVVSVYLIQYSIIVTTVLLDLAGFPGRVNSVYAWVECDRVRPSADFQPCNHSMLFEIKNHQFSIFAAHRKKPPLLKINRHAGWPYAWSKRPLPDDRPVANIDCSHLVAVF